MKLTTFFMCALGLGNMAAVCEEKADVNAEIVTGARTWRMTDGTTKRLRFTGFTKNPKYGMFQDVNRAPGGKPFSEFAKEEQTRFTAFKNGKLKLAVIPGLNMHPNFPTGKLPGWMMEDPHFRLGEARAWENSNGKKITARLACLTDEDVSLLIGENVSRIPLKSLGEADIAYLQQLKTGGQRTYSDKVTSGHMAWDGGKTYFVTLSGEKYAALAQQGSNFDKALRVALGHVKSKLESNKLNLDCFSETLWIPPSATHLSDANNAVTKNEKRPFFYVAEFFIAKSSAVEARRIWPLQTSPESWSGTPTLRIYVTADGAVLEAEEYIRSTP